jgi:hypothetical protein
MVAEKLGLLIAAFLLCTPYGVLAQGTGGVSGGVSSGVGGGSVGGGSLGNAPAPSSVGSVVGNATSVQGPSTVQSGNSLFQNPIGIGQNAPGAVPADTAQQQRNLGIGGQSSTPR